MIFNNKDVETALESIESIIATTMMPDGLNWNTDIDHYHRSLDDINEIVQALLKKGKEAQFDKDWYDRRQRDEMERWDSERIARGEEPFGNYGG